MNEIISTPDPSAPPVYISTRAGVSRHESDVSMAVVDLEIKRVELEAEDTLQRNRAALEISQQRVRELRASQENSRRRLRKIQRRLQEAGVSLDDDS